MGVGDLSGINGPTEPEMQIDDAVRIVELPVQQQLDRLDGQAGFFEAFANCTVTWRFIRLAFAAGEFRQSGQRAVISTDAGEKAVLVFDHSDADAGWRHVPLPGGYE